MEWFSLGLEAAGRLVDFVQSKGAPYNTDEFMEAHSDAMRKGLGLMNDVQSLDRGELQKGARGVLQLLAAVVDAYHRNKKIQINANYMTPVQPTEELVQEARFCTKDRTPNSFRCFLVLQEWAHAAPAFPDRVVLPVEHGDERISSDGILFGAPRAYVDRKSYLVSDTDAIYEHTADIEKELVRRDIMDYFKRHRDRLRSFVSIPILPPPTDHTGRPPSCGDICLGVVNIQSNHSRLTGLFPGNRRKLEVALQPLIEVLARFVLRLHFPASNG